MRVLMTGASGFLGSQFLATLSDQSGSMMTALRSGARWDPLCAPAHEVVLSDLLVPRDLEEALHGALPTHIVHIGAMSSAERCEQQPQEAYRANVTSTEFLRLCAERWGAHLTLVSTDLVFDGMKAPDGGLTEDTPPHPLSVYARSKSEAELVALRYQHAAVVRLSLLYGHGVSRSKGVLGWMEERLSSARELELFEDEYRTPIHVCDAVRMLMAVAEQRLTGTWHCGGPERISRVAFGQEVATALGYDRGLIRPIARSTFVGSPQRPEDVSLNSRRLYREVGFVPFRVHEALQQYPKS